MLGKTGQILVRVSQKEHLQKQKKGHEMRHMITRIKYIIILGGPEISYDIISGPPSIKYIIILGGPEIIS